MNVIIWIFLSFVGIFIVSMGRGALKDIDNLQDYGTTSRSKHKIFSWLTIIVGITVMMIANIYLIW